MFHCHYDSGSASLKPGLNDLQKSTYAEIPFFLGVDSLVDRRFEIYNFVEMTSRKLGWIYRFVHIFIDLI